MGLTCGVDIIEIDRIKGTIGRVGNKFIDKVFTENEIRYCEQKKTAKFQSYAARFAAKEATVKALGVGISKGIQWKNIEIINDENSKPYLYITGKAMEVYKNLNGVCLSLSMSHCREYAVANVVIETKY